LSRREMARARSVPSRSPLLPNPAAPDAVRSLDRANEREPASMTLAADGWLEGARRAPSPNADARPEGTPVSLLVLHNISLPPGEFGGPDIEALFTNQLDCSRHPFYAQLRDSRVSAHLLIRRDGEAVQFVPFDQRAWHAGASRWKERERCNDFSIGIELEGIDSLPYTEEQYASLVRVTRLLHACFPIEDIVGHSEVAPERKTDPGPAFDWALFRRLLAAQTEA
jgi:AmpD protein